MGAGWGVCRNVGIVHASDVKDMDSVEIAVTMNSFDFFSILNPPSS
jgi:hypothetical protein